MPDPVPVTTGRSPEWRAALFGLCPACNAPTLFAGTVRFAPACTACEQDFSGYNVGDGPAAFLTLGIGALVTALALTLELNLHPPFWVHVLLWLPFTIGAVVLGLRLAKAWLLTAEHQRQAVEGRLAQENTDDGA